MVLQTVWMVCGDAYHPSELGFHLMLASSSMVHPPIRAFFLDRLKAVDHHCVPQRRLQLQPEQMQEQERHPRYPQGSRYLGGGMGEGIQTSVMGFCCPRLVELQVEDCSLFQKVEEDQELGRSYHFAQEVAQQKDRDRRS